jgi:hypothetical protein
MNPRQEPYEVIPLVRIRAGGRSQGWSLPRLITGIRSRAVANNKKLKLIVYELCAMLFALCSSVEAQQPGKIPRIGYLGNSTASGTAVFLEAFRQELSKLGWIEGKNIIIEYRFAEQKLERLPELAADLVRLKVDLIVASGGPTPLAAKGATSTIPIVMTSTTDPVSEGLVASLARPGGNVTGLASLSPELNTTARDTQGRSPQAHPRCASPVVGNQHSNRPPTERPQACGYGTETQIGGDQNSTRRQRLRERLSKR